MPTYDYECGACGKVIEIFHSMTAPTKRKCPECGALKLKKLIGGGAGFLFKGSGFYITDYRSDDYKAKAKADTDKASSDSKSKDSKDSKKPSSGSDGASKKSSSESSSAKASS